MLPACIYNLPILVLLICFIGIINTVPLPSFDDLSPFYPGYRHYGGIYNNKQLFLLLGNATTLPVSTSKHEDTSALRLSIALNRLGGDHSLGTKQIQITKGKSADSIKGRFNLQYIFRTAAFGPYLARKYGSPELYFTRQYSTEDILSRLHGRKGILRILTFRNEGNLVDARIQLWNCTKLYKSRDYIHMHHRISMEFWELAGVTCPS